MAEMLRRRFRLRYAVPGVAALFLLVLSGCGGDTPRAEPASNTLIFTRADGSRFTVQPGEVTCGPDEHSGQQTVFVRPSVQSYDRTKPGMTVEATLADVGQGGTVKLPEPFRGPGVGPYMFVYDTQDPKAVQGNELSSQVERAGGEIDFQTVSCSPRPEIAFTVDATLGSEFSDLASVKVQGSFRGSG